MAQDSLTFAVITDSHVKLDSGDHSSPYPSSRQASDRNRYVIGQLNGLAPDFVIHLGDLVQPVPVLPAYRPAMGLARSILEELKMPLHVIPGNHDVGDKPLDCLPAPLVNQAGLDLFAQFCDGSYRSFDWGGWHFVLLNTPVMNSGLPAEVGQQEWLEEDLGRAAQAGQQILMFLHYPVFLHDAGEQEHYDNLGEPARSWLLRLIAAHGVQAVFSGHVHHFFYNRVARTELFVLPALAFVRQDYSELFPVDPADEYGRNDSSKLGFLLVQLSGSQMDWELVRTYGATEAQPPAYSVGPRWLWRRTREASRLSLGVYLRHSWATTVSLPYGNVDEFARKQARNDYPLLALHEMGIRSLRIPLRDFEDSTIASRIDHWRQAGFRFTAFGFGVPSDLQLAMLEKHGPALAELEWIVAPGSEQAVVDRLRPTVQHAATRLLVSPFESSQQYDPRQGATFNHFVGHGLKVTDRESFERLCQAWRGVADGFVFRAGPGERPWEVAQEATRLAASLNTVAVVHVRMQWSVNPAEVCDDQVALVGRVISSLMAARLTGAGRLAGHVARPRPGLSCAAGHSRSPRQSPTSVSRSALPARQAGGPGRVRTFIISCGFAWVGRVLHLDSGWEGFRAVPRD